MSEAKKKADGKDAPAGGRLQKILADAGIASRRKAEQYILEGRVQVNGAMITELGTRADPTKDHIRVDGKLLQGAAADGPARRAYLMMNKPKGYVTTVSDPEHRPTVMDLIPTAILRAHGKVRFFPVGRLDYLSEGLLLLTNDGALANSITRAATGVEKTYLVKVSGNPEPGGIERLRSGVMIERTKMDLGMPGVAPDRKDRVITAPAKIREFRDGNNPWFEVTLVEGRNRQLRKMFEEIGHHVEKIRRVGYGPLVLDIPPGQCRELRAGEVTALERAAKGKHTETRKLRPKFATVNNKPTKPSRKKRD
jgi:23S rRNA pseudouridine2605 synthase